MYACTRACRNNHLSGRLHCVLARNQRICTQCWLVSMGYMFFVMHASTWLGAGGLLGWFWFAGSLTLSIGS